MVWSGLRTVCARFAHGCRAICERYALCSRTGRNPFPLTIGIRFERGLHVTRARVARGLRTVCKLVFWLVVEPLPI